MGKGIENLQSSDDLELVKENSEIGAAPAVQKTEEAENNNNSERIVHIFGFMRTPWDDVVGKSEEGKVKNPNSYIVFWRMLIGFIFGLVFTAIFKLLVYLVVVHTPLVTYGYYSNSFSVLLVSTTIFYWFLYSLGKTSGPESVFRYSINFTAVTWLILSIVSISVFYNKNYDEKRNALKWYRNDNGRIVEMQNATNSTDTTKNGTKYFIDCVSGDTCYLLTVDIRKKMEAQSRMAPIESAVATTINNDSVLIPRNEAYRFKLDSGQVTKLLSFPEGGKFHIVWHSDNGKFLVLIDTNHDGLTEISSEPDAAYSNIGSFKHSRIRFQGKTNNMFVDVLVSK